MDNFFPADIALALLLFHLHATVSVAAGMRLGRVQAPLARGAYLKAVLALGATGATGWFAAVYLRMSGLAAPHPAAPILTIAELLLSLFLYGALVRLLPPRLLDAGLNPRLTWFCLLPVANLVIFMIGCLAPTRRRMDRTEPIVARTR